MSRLFKPIGGVVALVLVFVVGLYSFRALVPYQARTPEGAPLLTPVPDAASFEPRKLPGGPILKNGDADGFAIDFGYKVGGTPYSYALVLTFPGNATTGRATVTARHEAHEASVETSAVRRWDAPRKAYAVALQDKFMSDPPMPSLCIKAIVGPKLDDYELSDGSLCVALRDSAGLCHPETLACGLIR